MKNHQLTTQKNLYMPALTGIRFFAIFHIFTFHIAEAYHNRSDDVPNYIFSDYTRFPNALQNFISNGWMSTSFFFILSGFLLAFVYADDAGKLTMSKRNFFAMRFSRIYPVHIIVSLISFALFGGYLLQAGKEPAILITSAFTTLTLTQAWFPSHVPIWNWPAWTLSALVFLYLLTPLILPRLMRLTLRRTCALLMLAPLVSLVPTIIYALFFAESATSQYWQIFISATPLFWLAQFCAGIALCRYYRLKQANTAKSKNFFITAGDVSLLTIIGLAALTQFDEGQKYFLRHGLMMPLFMLLILDLARQRGFFAQILSRKLCSFLGEAGFSIFIWQNLIVAICVGIAMGIPTVANFHFVLTCAVMLTFGLFSAYVIERPLTRQLRKRVFQRSKAIRLTSKEV